MDTNSPRVASAPEGTLINHSTNHQDTSHDASSFDTPIFIVFMILFSVTSINFLLNKIICLFD